MRENYLMARQSLKLFDEFEREYLGPSLYSEPHWEYLNRTDRLEYHYVRDLLQNWFDNYETSPEKRSRLCREFRSTDDIQHLSAFFELYLYQLFKNQDFKIEVEPSWEQGRPDFLLTSPQGEKILLEATGVYPEKAFGSAKKLEQRVIDHINQYLESPDFFLHINIRNAPNNTPPYGQILRHLRKQLSQLDYEQVAQKALESEGMGLQRFPLIPWEHEAWTIEFIAIPKAENARGKPDVRPVGSMFYGIELVDTELNIKSRIDNKYGHYGELDIPFILALNVLDSYTNDETVAKALFGDEATNYNLETGEILNFRKPNGSWFGPSGYQKRRMSGVCIFKRLRPENMHLVDPVLWHHPYANNPLNPSLLDLRQWIPNRDKGGYEFKDGKPLLELLKLDEAKMPK